jgi:site-specific DNA recombinase
MHSLPCLIYRQRVDGLQEAFAVGTERDQAHQAIRGLIDRVVLTPAEGVLKIDLHGEVAAILQLSAPAKKAPSGRASN